MNQLPWSFDKLTTQYVPSDVFIDESFIQQSIKLYKMSVAFLALAFFFVTTSAFVTQQHNSFGRKLVALNMANDVS